MPSTDLAVSDPYMARVRRMYPGAVSTGRVTGTRHLVRAEIKRMAKRGEVIPVDRFTREIRPGVLAIPYIRMKERSQVRREQALKFTAVTLTGITIAAGAGWLVWESRYVLVALAGVLLAAAGVFWLSLHWTRGCSGLHCSGCRG